MRAAFYHVCVCVCSKSHDAGLLVSFRSGVSPLFLALCTQSVHRIHAQIVIRECHAHAHALQVPFGSATATHALTIMLSSCAFEHVATAAGAAAAARPAVVDKYTHTLQMCDQRELIDDYDGERASVS